jgi:hypothetical protein
LFPVVGLKGPCSTKAPTPTEEQPGPTRGKKLQYIIIYSNPRKKKPYMVKAVKSMENLKHLL